MMKINLLLMTVCLIVLLQFAIAASAAVIGSYTVNSDPVPGGPEGLPWMANLWFSYKYGGLPPTLVLFNGRDGDNIWEPGIDIPSNIGKTFWAASDQDDPEFSQVVSMLTGEERVFGFINNNCNAAYPIWWSDMMGESTDRRSLHGYTIERIGLRIDSAAMIPSSTGLYIYSATLTAIFEGYSTVPEPSTILVLIVGIGGMWGSMNTQRRKK